MKIIDTRNMEEKIMQLKREEEKSGTPCLNTQQRLLLDPYYCEEQGRPYSK
jgi:hypothetical protein